MPSAEQLAFWAAIRANPDDDTPRLVYADWLQENGDEPRAEFIRVQCALAALGPDRRKGKKQRPALEAKQTELFARHGEQWLAPFRNLLKGSKRFDQEDQWLKRLDCRRGFVNLMYLSLEPAARLATAGDELEPFGPCDISDCKADHDHDRVKAICHWPGAGCVTGLSISGATDQDVVAIVRSTSLRNLRRLGLWFGTVSDAGIVQLSVWQHLSGLRYLDLKDNPITDVGASVLVESEHCTNLNRLDLYRTRIGPSVSRRLRERFGDRLSIEPEPQ